MKINSFEDIQAWQEARELRSASEVQSHLYVALDQSYLSADQFKKVSDEIVKVKNLIYGFIRYLKKGK